MGAAEQEKPFQKSFEKIYNQSIEVSTITEAFKSVSTWCMDF